MKINSFISIAATVIAVLMPVASAANSFYAPGDLVLFFQKDGGGNTVYANLGSAAAFRGTAAGPNVTSSINFQNINTVLINAFGVDWASDPTVYAGLAGVFSTVPTSTLVTSDDPTRTAYVSQSRQNVGTVGQAGSEIETIGGNTAMTTLAAGIFSQNNIFENNYDAIAVVSPTGVSFIDEQNTFLAPGIQGAAFETFAAGIQQQGAVGSFGTLGAAGNVEFALDLYRILARGTGGTGTGSTGTGSLPGQIAGNLREGSYEGTITVNASGQVSFIGQGAAVVSNYQTWALSFPALATPTDKLPETDFDNDGYTNLVEFVLNGNPSVSGQTIAPTLNASGANFVFGFNRRADSTTEVTQIFEYSDNLVDWITNPPITIPTTPGTVGFVTVGASSGTAPNQVQAVTLTIPKGSNTKLFGRLKAVK